MGKGKNTKKKEEIRVNGSIEEKTVVKNFIVSNTILCWRIRKYDELKKCTLYYQIYEGNDLKCVFKLIKMRKTLYVALRCDINNKQTVFYIANGDFASSSCISKEIASGLYFGRFSQASIYSSFGDFYKTGLLTIVFSILLDEEITCIREYDYSRLEEMRDFDGLCNDIGKMYLQGVDSDFIINSIGASFRVHKYILLARSDFFREFFAKQDHPSVFTVNANAGIVHLVLLYCYSGQLLHVADDCLIATLSVAKELKITSLIERCQENLGSHRRDYAQFADVSEESQSN